MCKADAAEWILSLTTTTERAASTAGDLAEEAGSRGTLWFWCRLFRVTACMIWQVWVDAPFRMLGLALAACLLNVLFLAISTVAVLVVGIVAVDGIKRLGLAANPEHVIAYAGVAWASLASQFLIGRWLARRAPGKEIPACLAYLCLDATLWTLLMTATSFTPAPSIWRIPSWARSSLLLPAFLYSPASIESAGNP